MDTEARMTRRARRPGRVQLAVVVRRIDERSMSRRKCSR